MKVSVLFGEIQGWVSHILILKLQQRQTTLYTPEKQLGDHGRRVKRIQLRHACLLPESSICINALNMEVVAFRLRPNNEVSPLLSDDG